MRFLVDEMFPPIVADELRILGHEACHVRDVGLAGAPDTEVLHYAMVDDQVVVTENAIDFVTLLDAVVAGGLTPVAVVLALKRGLPTGSVNMATTLARRLHRWAVENPQPYRHVHWLSSTSR